LDAFDGEAEVKAMSRRWWFYGDDSDLEINPEVTGQQRSNSTKEKIDKNEVDNSTHRVSIVRVQHRPKINVLQPQRDSTASFRSSGRVSLSLNSNSMSERASNSLSGLKVSINDIVNDDKNDNSNNENDENKNENNEDDEKEDFDDEDGYESKHYFNHSIVTEELTNETLRNTFDMEYITFFHMVPIVKKNNYRKHNSHQWFFNGVCSGLNDTIIYAFLTGI
jgi:hypothetical protein